MRDMNSRFEEGTGRVRRVGKGRNSLRVQARTKAAIGILLALAFINSLAAQALRPREISAASFGSVEGSNCPFRWNADAGAYNWPGFDGVSSFPGQVHLYSIGVGHIYRAIGRIDNLDSLMHNPGGVNEFAVEMHSIPTQAEDAPQIMLESGRDANGRLRFVSDSGGPAEETIRYGESDTEAHVCAPAELSEASAQVEVNPKSRTSTFEENASRVVFNSNQPGHYGRAKAHEHL